MSERRSITICAVVERPDHHCGDDLVTFICMLKLNHISQQCLARHGNDDGGEKERLSNGYRDAHQLVGSGETLKQFAAF